MQYINSFFERHNMRKAQTLYLLFMHVLSLCGLIHLCCNPQHLLRFLAVEVAFHSLYALGITGGSHRLWAHKSYTASPPLKVLLMLLNAGANQGSIFHWARDHRLHHKFSDTEYDPHTMARGFFFAHVGWLLEKKSDKMIEQGKKINLDDLKADPVVMFQKRHYTKLAILMCFILPGSHPFYSAITYSLFLPCSLLAGYLYATVSYVGLLHATWCVNSVCHRFGSRPWNKDILPADNYLVSILTNGEGFHNWHHQYPFDWRASKDEWYMWNPTARFIEFSRLLGLASVKY